MKSKIEPYTKKEVREQLLDHIRGIVRYWAEVEGQSQADRCDGVAFSILAALDGSSVALPGFLVIPDPHPDDKAYHLSLNERYYEDAPKAARQADIGGSLHEEFYRPEETHDKA